MPERVFLPTPIASGRGGVIVSPFQFLLTGDDHLRVEAWNVAPGAALELSYRFAGVDGQIIAERQVLPLTSDRMKVEHDFPMREGYLVNMAVFVTGGVSLVGQTFCCVKLIRGFTGATIVLGLLLQGGVGPEQGLAWPGSPIVSSHEYPPDVRTIVGTMPAVLTDFAETCPTGARWQLLNLRGALQASAGVGDRLALLRMTHSGALGTLLGPSKAVTAGQTIGHQWAANLPLNPVLGTGESQQAFPRDLFLKAGDSFGSLTVGLLAGDQWSAPVYIVKEWLEAA